MFEVIMCRISVADIAKRLIAQLSLSLPPEVKYIYSGSAPIHSAIVFLACFIAILGFFEKK